MRILISNDDGVRSNGIYCLAKALKSIADIVVVAPSSEQSGVSNSLTISRPLSVGQLENGFFHIDGTPTDCVRVALRYMFINEKFDFVVSGINNRSNLADDILYSGTVAAAREGRMFGIPSIAISLADLSEEYKENFDVVARMSCFIVKNIYTKKVEFPDSILNINIPDVEHIGMIRGIRITKIGKRKKLANILKHTIRRRDMYWLDDSNHDGILEAGTDFHAIHNSMVSITPILVDTTNHDLLDKLSNICR